MGMEPLDKIFSKIDFNNIKENTSKTLSETDNQQDNCKICQNTRWILSENNKTEPCICQENVWGTNTKIRIEKYSEIGHLSEVTFDNIKLGVNDFFSDPSSFRKAYHEAISFAQQPTGWIVFAGPSGTGKSLLCASITNYIISQNKPVKYIVSQTLIDQIKSSFFEENNDNSNAYLQALNAPVLVIDDYGFKGGSQWANERIDQLLTERYNKRLPTAISTSLQREKIENRMFNRFTDSFSTFLQIKNLKKKINPEKIGISNNMLRKMNLNNFDIKGTLGNTTSSRRTLREAFDVAKSFSEKPEGWLYFHGPTGIGKTHLAIGIANICMKNSVDIVFRFLPDLLDELRESFGPDSSSHFDKTFDHIKKCDVLILDDFGSQRNNPWVDEKLFQIINHRHNEILPTIITSRINLSEKKPNINISNQFFDPIISRFRDGLVVTERFMNGLDYRYRGFKNK